MRNSWSRRPSDASAHSRQPRLEYSSPSFPPNGNRFHPINARPRHPYANAHTPYRHRSWNDDFPRRSGGHCQSEVYTGYTPRIGNQSGPSSQAPVRSGSESHQPALDASGPSHQRADQSSAQTKQDPESNDNMVEVLELLCSNEQSFRDSPADQKIEDNKFWRGLLPQLVTLAGDRGYSKIKAKVNSVCQPRRHRAQSNTLTEPSSRLEELIDRWNQIVFDRQQTRDAKSQAEELALRTARIPPHVCRSALGSVNDANEILSTGQATVEDTERARVVFYLLSWEHIQAALNDPGVVQKARKYVSQFAVVRENSKSSATPPGSWTSRALGYSSSSKLSVNANTNNGEMSPRSPEPQPVLSTMFADVTEGTPSPGERRPSLPALPARVFPAARRDVRGHESIEDHDLRDETDAVLADAESSRSARKVKAKEKRWKGKEKATELDPDPEFDYDGTPSPNVANSKGNFKGKWREKAKTMQVQQEETDVDEEGQRKRFRDDEDDIGEPSRPKKKQKEHEYRATGRPASASVSLGCSSPHRHFTIPSVTSSATRSTPVSEDKTTDATSPATSVSSPASLFDREESVFPDVPTLPELDNRTRRHSGKLFEFSRKMSEVRRLVKKIRKDTRKN